MPTVLSLNTSRAVDVNGFAVPGALATFYRSGTTSEATVYADAECTVPHPSPLAANGAGVFAPVYSDGDGDLKVLITTAEGVALPGYPIDPVIEVSTDITGASSVDFEPTAEIPVTNVQAAIEQVQANIVEPLADYGLGVTGNASLLANIDAIGIASGVYRFNGDTIGTFPSGMNADTGGIVRIWRATGSTAIMTLSASGARRQHVRTLSGGEWGAWSYLMQSSDTANDAAWRAGTSTASYVVSPASVKEAIGALAIGGGQTWTAPNRSANTVYRNTTGRPIMVNVQGYDCRYQVRPTSSSAWVTVGESFTATDGRQGQSFIVPDGHYYRANLKSGTAAFDYWAELR